MVAGDHDNDKCKDDGASAKRATSQIATPSEAVGVDAPKRRRSVNSGAANVPKDLLSKCVVASWNADKYSDRPSADDDAPAEDEEEEEEFDEDFSDEDGEPVKTWCVCLDVPYAKCWLSLQEAQEFLPGLTQSVYASGKLELARMKVILPDTITFATRHRINAQKLNIAIDSCDSTNIEKKMGGGPGNKRLPLFRSYSLQNDPLNRSCGMIFIDTLQVHDERLWSHGIGSFLLETGLQLIDAKFSNETGPVYLKPFPLVWMKKEGDLPPLPDDPFKHKTRSDAQKQQIHADTLRVIDWWKKKGFREVEGSKKGGVDECEYGYMVRGVESPASTT
eukprot:g1794.t1